MSIANDRGEIVGSSSKPKRGASDVDREVEYEMKPKSMPANTNSHCGTRASLWRVNRSHKELLDHKRAVRERMSDFDGLKRPTTRVPSILTPSSTFLLDSMLRSCETERMEVIVRVGPKEHRRLELTLGPYLMVDLRPTCSRRFCFILVAGDDACVYVLHRPFKSLETYSPTDSTVARHRITY